MKTSKEIEDRIKDRIIDFLEYNAERVALAVHVLDISTFLEVTWRLERKGLRSLDLEMIQFLRDNLGELPLVAANKIDKAGNRLVDSLSEMKNRLNELNLLTQDKCIFPVSAKTGEGLGSLKNEVHKRLVDKGHKNPFNLLRGR
jgi:GTP-binding protein EngB required for normal cell division